VFPCRFDGCRPDQPCSYASVTGAAVMRTGDPFTPLLDLALDLGRLVPTERVREARAQLGVRVTFVGRGVWYADRLSAAGPEHLGLLMLDGVIAREVLLADTTSIELVGLRPWQRDDDAVAVET
jgi:hypothetical protein